VLAVTATLFAEKVEPANRVSDPKTAFVVNVRVKSTEFVPEL